METLFQDVRFAVRTLRLSSGFTSLAVLCLAIGIGVNTTIFSALDGIVLHPYPFAHPESLVLPMERLTRSGDRGWLSYQAFLDLKRQATSFSDVAGYTMRSLTLEDGVDPERVNGAGVTWNMLPMIGATPAIGRLFRPDEDTPGAEGTIILGNALWQRHFGGSLAILGRSIDINGAPYTVIGVMPPRFGFPYTQEAWVTLSPLYKNVRLLDHGSVSAMARLRTGATFLAAKNEMAAFGTRLASTYPLGYAGSSMTLSTLDAEMMGDDVRLVTMAMMAAVSFLLLIACANVGNLMLARATGRSRELAVRAALGAGRGRIVRQLLTESVIVSVIAGVAAIGVAKVGLKLIDAAVPPQNPVPYFIVWPLNQRALLYAFVVSLATGLIFGLAPALAATRQDLQTALRESGRGGGAGVRGNRLRSAFVVIEVALSVVLLVGASLFIRSFVNLQNGQTGFDPAPLMTLRFYMAGTQYQEPRAMAQRVEDIVRRVEELPGVQSAFASNQIPLTSGGSGGGVIIDGRPVPPGDEPQIFLSGVTHDFLRTLRVPLLHGRYLTEAESRDSSGLAVINQTMASKLWPDVDPIGRRFKLAGDSAAHWFTVVGVAQNFTNVNPSQTRTNQLPAAYVPYIYVATRNTGLVMRTASAPAAITAAARGAVRTSDPGLPIFAITTMRQAREDGYWQYGLFGKMFATFGGIALLLASIGMYAVIAFGVTQRTREIGIRLALGAKAMDVLSLVVRHGVALAVMGIVFGVVAAGAVTRMIGTLLVGVSPTDPLSFGAIALFLMAVAALASYLPARRATRVDPLEALRND